MAKETKQDRVVRNMYDQVMEHLHEIKNLEAASNSKESDVERWCSSFLKSCLGYTSSSNYVIKAQDSKGNLRPDLVVYKQDKPLFLVEVKKIGFDFDKSDFRSGKVQLNEYLNAAGGVRYGLLTNGIEWRIYDFSNPQYGGIEISRFDLKVGENETFAFDKRSVEYLCYEMLDFHESSYTAGSWEELSKEAMAFSPESLAKAILSADVIKYIGKSIRGEHEYKANLEALTDKVLCLLEKGLNEAIVPWNEAKVIELQKYVKSQKRATRRVKRSSKKNASVEDQAQSVDSPLAEVHIEASEKTPA